MKRSNCLDGNVNGNFHSFQILSLINSKSYLIGRYLGIDQNTGTVHEHISKYSRAKQDVQKYPHLLQEIYSLVIDLQVTTQYDHNHVTDHKYSPIFPKCINRVFLHFK